MKKKLLTAILAFASTLCLCFGIAACGPADDKAPSADVWTIERVYAQATELGFSGSLDDLIAAFKGDPGKDGVGVKKIYINEKGSLIIELTEGEPIDLGVIRGADGTDGENGKDGVTPHIGENGHWFIGEQDTGIKAEGTDGADGQDGTDGTNGKDGVTPHIGENGHWFIGEQDTGIKAEGTDGTNGTNGTNGKDGTNGTNGKDGVTPHIGENGHWFIGEQDTGIKAEGTDGKDGTDGEDGAPGVQGEKGQDGRSITNVEITEDGHLVLTFSDNSTLDLGVVVGTNGRDGLDGQDGACGEKGEKGDTGVGIQSVEFDANGDLKVTYTDGSERTIFVPRCNHVYPDEWTTGLEPTCTSIGYIYQDCQKCGFRIYEFQEAKGHYCYSYPTYNDDGHHYFCARCSELIQEAHKYDEHDQCTVCKYTCDFSRNLSYKLNADMISYSVIDLGSCSDKDIIIPETYLGLPVTEIGPDAFNGCNDITSVVIGNNVTTICEGAFYNCYGLVSVTMGEKVKVIKENAFGYVYEDDQHVVSMTEVHISNLSAWCKIDFASSFASNPLYHAHHLYLNDEEITTLRIPMDITEIKAHTFSYCLGIENIVFTNNVIAIGSDAFGYCAGLKSISIPNSVTRIGSWAFSYTGLQDVQIPNSVESIGVSVFACSVLKNIEIPASVISIGKEAFSGCAYLEAITVSEDNSLYSSQDGILYNKAKTKILHVPSCIKGSIAIPASVTSIGEWAFGYCSSLTSITIPASVTSIGEWAFGYCSSLESITIPARTSIASNAFSSCDSIQKVYYGGTKEEWERKGWSRYSGLSQATCYFFSDGKPSEEQWTESPNWWHFDAETGEAVEWKKENQ